jgi:putative FmdB family regulatory protein
MPTYEYECEACGHGFEQFQSITAAPIKKCPKCGKNKVKRLLGTGAGLIFKGSGFYITDYRSDSYNKAAKAEGGGGGAGEKASSNGEAKTGTSGDSAGGKSEAKPAAASEPKPAAKSQPKSDPKPKSKGK